MLAVRILYRGLEYLRSLVSVQGSSLHSSLWIPRDDWTWIFYLPFLLMESFLVHCSQNMLFAVCCLGFLETCFMPPSLGQFGQIVHMLKRTWISAVRCSVPCVSVESGFFILYSTLLNPYWICLLFLSGAETTWLQFFTLWISFSFSSVHLTLYFKPWWVHTDWILFFLLN